MSGLHIYTSNQLEKLAQIQAQVLNAPVQNPLMPETVVVHSRGMGQWLAMAIAEHNGICANVAFPFPDAFLDDLLETGVPEPGKSSFFKSDNLIFTIMKTLPGCLERPEFETIRHYLADADEQKLFGLSEKLAALFDQYLIFRPDMVMSWEKGPPPHWQASLWQKISEGRTQTHRAGRRNALLETIKNRPENLKSLPDRISFFGISHLPPFHLDVMAALAGMMDIHLFLVNPCREFWGDIVTTREKNRLRGSGPSIVTYPSYFETGNPLLASWGTMGREFINMVHEYEDRIPTSTIECYVDTEPHNWLTTVQAHILDLMDGTRQPTLPASKLPATDDSIQIHSCHGPLREMEILHTHLLAMLETDSALKPRDIIVMAPDIAAYEPFVHAVFGNPPDEKLKIPYHVTDRSVLRENPVAEGLLMLLDAARSRFGASQVMALLDVPFVREKYHLAESDVGQVEKWIADLNVRWGIDGRHKARLGLPESNEHTWQAGLDRLLLGYAMPAEMPRLFEDMLPYDAMEGGRAEVLGHFMEFFSRLVWLADILKSARSLADWGAVLSRVVDTFFQVPDSDAGDIQVVRDVMAQLAECQAVSENDDELEIGTVVLFLEKQFAGHGAGAGFVTGNVTFCTLLPFRSIPAKVICMIGMNNDGFPRQYAQPGFDLMARHPEPGDRIKRNDDKYLFLQALISARDKLYISYVGQSNRDNTPMSPSVIVDELADYMAGALGADRNGLIIKHRLQAFSEAYFSDEGPLFSYSVEDYETCRSARDSRAGNFDASGFFTGKLLPPEDDGRLVSLDALGFFLTNPSKYLLETRLGIVFREKGWALEDDEPFALDPLTRYSVGQDLAAGHDQGIGPVRLEKLQKAMGRLPHGGAGHVVFTRENTDAREFVEKTDALKNGEMRPPVDLVQVVDGFTVTGRLKNIYPEHLLKCDYAATKAKYLLRAWVYHLALDLIEDDTSPKTTLLVLKDATWVFTPVPDNRALLKDLLALYWEGTDEAGAVFSGGVPDLCGDAAEKKKNRCRSCQQCPFEMGGK